MSDRVFDDINSKIDVEPPELGKEVFAVLSQNLSKLLAPQYNKPWTDKLESDLQEAISTLIAACNARGLDTIRLHYTSPNGEKAIRDLDVAKIAKTRTLQ